MQHRRTDESAAEAGERGRAAGTTEPGVPGDLRVAGPPSRPPVMDAPEPVPDTIPDPIPVPDAGRGEAATGSPAPSGGPEKLMDLAEAERFRERWHAVQSAFVDDPGESVRRADDLASEAVDALGRAIAAHRRKLSEALGTGERADTERLRLALRGYRDLLDRIFAA
ncbi:hypothetical protein [Spirillospora sp. CA-128828]|uniref:hypothetical protein n=1 Tax=Spirillospora sp. CA-128828 TaxID=3240033 RepID=UPI003D8BE3B3